MIPGRRITLVLDTDLLREEIIIRNSIVYDVDGDSVIIAQTEPRLSSRDFERTILLSYVERVGERRKRFAVKAKIERFIKGYRLSDGNEVEAVSVRKTGEPYEYNLRRFFRVQVTSKSGLRLYIGEDEYPLLDISVGGCSFLSKSIPSFSEGDTVKIWLCKENERMELKGNILRVSPQGSSEKGIIYQVCLEFAQPSPDLRRSLTNLVYELEKISTEFLTRDRTKNNLLRKNVEVKDLRGSPWRDRVE